MSVLLTKAFRNLVAPSSINTFDCLLTMECVDIITQKCHDSSMFKSCRETHHGLLWVTIIGHPRVKAALCIKENVSKKNIVKYFIRI